MKWQNQNTLVKLLKKLKKTLKKIEKNKTTIMKIEIINKPMLCWDNDESKAEEWHVLAKVTECTTIYPFKVVANENTRTDIQQGVFMGFENVKALPQIVEMTVAEISKILGKTIKIIE